MGYREDHRGPGLCPVCDHVIRHNGTRGRSQIRRGGYQRAHDGGHGGGRESFGSNSQSPTIDLVMDFCRKRTRIGDKYKIEDGFSCHNNRRWKSESPILDIRQGRVPRPDCVHHHEQHPNLREESGQGWHREMAHYLTREYHGLENFRAGKKVRNPQTPSGAGSASSASSIHCVSAAAHVFTYRHMYDLLQEH